MIGTLRVFSILSALETVTVFALLINLSTVHDNSVAGILGPLHGSLYLAVAVAALLARGLTARTRAGALIPVLSGPLMMANLRREVRSR